MVSVFKIFVSLYSVQLARGFLQPAATTSFLTVPQQLSSAVSPLALAPVSPDDVSLLGDAFLSSSQFLSSILVKKYQTGGAAEAQFYFLFFAGSGAGGIGISQIPKIVKELNEIRTLSKEGVTEKGDPVSKNFLVSLLYPSDISQKDVLKAITKIPSAEQINKRGNSDSYVASKGYIVQKDFLQALEGCNPIASYALYQAVSTGRGKTVSPIEVDETLAIYKAEKGAGALTSFTKDFQKSALTKISSYVTLGFLLFLTFDLIIETGLIAFAS